jgi:hypothetical protein
MFMSRCTTQLRVLWPTLTQISVRRSSAARFVVSATAIPTISNDPDLMMHVSISQFDSARRAGFGLLAGSWDAPLSGRGDGLYAVAVQRVGVSDRDRAQHLKAGGTRYPRVIANEGQQGRMSALNHQRLDAVSNTGAGFDHGGCTP